MRNLLADLANEQVRIEQAPHLVARTINMKGQPVLVVHRSLAVSESSAMYRPVREFLTRCPHEAIVGPQDAGDDADMVQPSEIAIYRLSERGQ
ncbi:hypothetical protein [Mycobacterium sp. NPDC050853]|uniref:hypothetical protein n=1 Tax=Mycobacterium sp. NPDC050853 TaxID=3155160 RepID=UPI0033F7E93F